MIPARLEAAFWRHVHVPDVGGDAVCWTWTGALHRDGYGVLVRPRRRPLKFLAHRVSWEIHFGPVPEGMAVVQHCDNAACVRPTHLVLKTRREVSRTMVRHGRQPRGERNGRAHLSASQVREIRARYPGPGITQRSLAAEYGVGVAQIYRILTRQMWRHI